MFASVRSAADLALFPRSPYSVNGISSGEHCREYCVSKKKIVPTFLYLKACLCPNQGAEIIFWQSCLTKHKIDNEKSFAESFL